MFGMEVVLMVIFEKTIQKILTPFGTFLVPWRVKTINLLLYVGSFVRMFVRSGPTALTVQYFFLIFCMKLCLQMT